MYRPNKVTHRIKSILIKHNEKSLIRISMNESELLNLNDITSLIEILSEIQKDMLER